MSSDKNRKLPDNLAAQGEAAVAKLKAMPFVPDIELDQQGRWAPPYDSATDKDRWWAIFFNLLGTRQASVVDMFFAQLADLLGTTWREDLNGLAVDEGQLRAAFGIVQALKPRNAAEAAYAAQLFALHLTTMKLAAGVANYRFGDPRTAAIMAKTTRAFGDGLLTMRKLKGKGQRTVQKIEVHRHEHQHIHIEGEAENGGRGHATNGGAAAQRAALPRHNAGGEVVPIASRKR